MHSFIKSDFLLLRYFITLLRQCDNDDINMFLNLFHHIANTSMLKNKRNILYIVIFSSFNFLKINKI